MISNSYFDLKKLQFTRTAPAFAMWYKFELGARRDQAPSRPVGLRALRALAYDHNTPPPLA